MTDTIYTAVKNYVTDLLADLRLEPLTEKFFSFRFEIPEKFSATIHTADEIYIFGATVYTFNHSFLLKESTKKEKR